MYFVKYLRLSFVALLLTSCSALKIGYNQGENLVYWWIDGYVDLDQDQKPPVGQHINQFFLWHRQTQLKQYAELLQLIQKQLHGKPTEAMLLADFMLFKGHLQGLAQHALPGFAELALALKPSQLTQLKEKFESNNDKYRKNYLQGKTEKRQQFRYKKVLEQAEFWFGDFSASQELQIRQASDLRPMNHEIWLRERIRQQHKMLALLHKIQAGQPHREQVLALLQDFVVSYSDHHDNPEWQAYSDADNDATAHVAITIFNLTTPAQKARADKTLQNMIDDIEALAGQEHR